VDTELAAKDLLNSRMAYVSVSRGQWDAQIFTNNREKLPQALGHEVSHRARLNRSFQSHQCNIMRLPSHSSQTTIWVWA
jgi:hypothetical protein